jgi:hypothetical protein
LVFVPVILGKELVESAFALYWENVCRDSLDYLVAGRNKTGHVGLGVMFLPRRKALQVVDRFGTRQERRNREYRRFTFSLRAPPA